MLLFTTQIHEDIIKYMLRKINKPKSEYNKVGISLQCCILADYLRNSALALQNFYITFSTETFIETQYDTYFANIQVLQSSTIYTINLYNLIAFNNYLKRTSLQCKIVKDIIDELRLKSLINDHSEL